MGFCGLFNVDSLFEPSWLKGRINIEDYRESIRYINRKSIESQIGFSKIPSAFDINERETARGQAI